eukprot:m51a1_g1171 hypothetical protein (122) ;mRNA; f:375066-375647
MVRAAQVCRRWRELCSTSDPFVNRLWWRWCCLALWEPQDRPARMERTKQCWRRTYMRLVPREPAAFERPREASHKKELTVVDVTPTKADQRESYKMLKNKKPRDKRPARFDTRSSWAALDD